jgi:membrane fusion protein (multidrug efflux system)
MSEESKPEKAEQPVQPDQPAPKTVAKPPGRLRRWRKALIVVGVILFVIVIIPKIFHSWHTVSTDDAYVNSYVTFVAPRVIGQVARVLVDDNNRVKKDDVLVELDSEPYRVQVAIKQAAVDSAQAEVLVAEANARSQIAQARGFRFKLQHAIEDVDKSGGAASGARRHA